MGLGPSESAITSSLTDRPGTTGLTILRTYNIYPDLYHNKGQEPFTRYWDPLALYTATNIGRDGFTPSSTLG